MHGSRTRPSPSEVASELGALSAGLGILTMALFPFAVPGVLVFVVLPLALVALPALLLAALVVPPLWLARTMSRRRSAARVQRTRRETSLAPSRAVGGRPGDVMS
jgi:membrane protein implicated in regulation of membrane protease activity